MSGLTLTNFGMYSTSSGGNIWNIHSIGSVVFDGTVELQFNLKIKNE